jgi:Secretion system C-terminal sorting domain/Metallo-peptidase family M12
MQKFVDFYLILFHLISSHLISSHLMVRDFQFFNFFSVKSIFLMFLFLGISTKPIMSQSQCFTPENSVSGSSQQTYCVKTIGTLPSTNCNNAINYAPTLLNPVHTSIKTVRLVFHVFNRDNGTGNMQNTAAHIAFIDDVVAGVNGIFSNVTQINAGGIGTCPSPATIDNIIDSRIRFTRHPEVFFHNDSDYFSPTGGAFNTVSLSCEAYDLYVTNNPSLSTDIKDNAIHIFIFGCDDTCIGCAPCANSIGGLASGIPSIGIKYISVWKWFFYNLENNDPTWLSVTFQNLAHELGHSLGLWHTGGQDYCCDTRLVQNAGNDLMAYTNGWALTECQIARMQYFLEGGCGNNGVCSDIENAVITDFCTKNTTETITIATGQQIVWDTHRKLYSDVVVESGAQLTIRCTVGMPNGGNIAVRSGGRLIIDGGRVTHNSNLWDRCPDGKWFGITVDGNPTGNHHSLAMQSTMYTQVPLLDPGIVLTMNDAILEDATIALNASSSGTWGGLVYCKNTTFRNNVQSGAFFPYKFKNWSGFEKCIFIDEESTSNSRGVGLFGVRDVKFYDCQFSNFGFWGIGSYDSSPKVTFSLFEKNHHGIDAFAYKTLSSSLQIGSDDAALGNKFNDNKVGIYTGTINNLNVLSNVFKGNEFDASVNGEGQFVVKKNKFYGTLGLDMVNTLDKYKEAKCNYYENFIGMDMSGNNFGLYFNNEEFKTSYDVFLTNEGGITGKIIDQGGDNNANWCYFSQNNIQNINTTGATELFYYYHPDPGLYPKTRPKCSLTNPAGCVAPNNFNNSQTKGGNGGCLLLENTENVPPCFSKPCLETVKNEIFVVQDEINHGNNTPIKQTELQILTLKKSRIFWDIIDLYFLEENYLGVEELLNTESTTNSKRAMILLKSELAQYEEVQKLLNEFPSEEKDDSYFKMVQQINLNRWQKYKEFILSREDEASLVEIANSSYPSAAYAKGMLSELKDYLFEPTMTIPVGERNLSSDSLIKNQNLSVVPNPSLDKAVFYFPMQKTDKNRLIIVDARGAIVQSIQLSQNAISTTIEVSNLSSGLYYALLINNDSGSSQIKFVVAH